MLAVVLVANAQMGNCSARELRTNERVWEREGVGERENSSRLKFLFRVSDLAINKAQPM